MSAKDFTELIAWQRADELERFVLEISVRAGAICQLLANCDRF